jgi:hypothetical protein
MLATNFHGLLQYNTAFGNLSIPPAELGVFRHCLLPNLPPGISIQLPDSPLPQHPAVYFLRTQQSIVLV